MTDSKKVKLLQPGKARRFKRLLNDDGHFSIVALDQRAILQRMLAQAKQLPESRLPFADMLAVKKLLVDELSDKASAMLFDPNIAVPAALDALPRETGLLVSLEHHLVEESEFGRKTHSIPNWSVDNIQRLGADGVKVLLWYHPQADESVREHQKRYVQEIGKQCYDHELPFVLELLTYQPPADRNGNVAPAIDSTEGRATAVLGSIQEFTQDQYRVDLLKLESPVPSQALYAEPDVTKHAFNDIGAYCNNAQIPWVLLSGGVTTDEFVTVLDYAYAAGAQGFLAGRAIWKAPLDSFPDLIECRNKLNRDGNLALNRLLEITRQKARPYRPTQLSASALEAEGDFARWYANTQTD